MKTKRYSKNRLHKRPRILFILLIALLLLGAGSMYLLYSKDNSSHLTKETEEKDGINLAPPTEEDLKANKQHKKNLGNQTENNTGSRSNNTTGAVKPVITSSGIYGNSVEVGARVAGIFEKNGTCTLKLSKSGKIISKSQDATPNVSEMSCGFISISKSKLSSGTWTAQVTYKSNKYSGASDTVSVKI